MTTARSAPSTTTRTSIIERTTMNAWLILIVAIFTEVCGTTCMKLSEGFSRVVPSILLYVFYGLSFMLLTLALKTLDVSVAYAVWSAVGTACIAVIGVIYFKEPVTALRVGCLLLIIIGVVGLQLSSPSAETNKEQAARQHQLDGSA